MSSMEFVDVEGLEWTDDPIDGALVKEKILHRDEETGSYTRLVKTAPGFEGKHILRHDFDEVVYILEGGMINLRSGNVYMTNMVAYFPKGMEHGPFKTPVGTVNLEFRHYKGGPAVDRQPDPNAMEFIDVETLEWTDDAIFGAKAREKILHKDKQTGTHTRFIRTAPGFKGGAKRLKHDFDEVVYILKGGMINKETGNAYPSETVAYFKKRTEHGPFETPLGVLNWEVRHYK